MRPIDGATARQHLNAIVAAAGEPVSAPRRRPWRALVAAAAAAFVLPAGLAVAGVSLPAAVERPYGAVGIALPHQQQATPTPAPVTRPIEPPATPSPTPTPEHRAGGKRQPPAGAHHGERSKSARGKHGSGRGGSNSGGGTAGRGDPGRGNGGNPARGSAGGGNPGRGNAGRGNPGRGKAGGNPGNGSSRGGKAGGSPSRAGSGGKPGRRAHR